MTVQLKTTTVRNAVKEMLASVPSNSPVLLLARGMQIDLDAGEVTIKFKPNGQPDQKKPATKKAKAEKPAIDDSGLTFARGEKKAMRDEYKTNIENEDDIKVNMFGKVITVKDVEVMIVGFENGKFRVRKANDKVVNGTKKAVLEALSGEAPAKKKPVSKKPAASSSKAKKKPAAKKKQASSGTKQSKKSGAKLIKTKVTGKNPYSATKKTEMKKKFVVQAKKLSTKGLSSGLFWKPIQIEDRVYRIIAASAQKEQVRLLNVKTGKTVVKAVSAVFPLSN